MNWQPIDTFPLPKNDYLYADSPKSVLVDNGDHIGEAELKQDWGSLDDEENPTWRWAWTHRSTCSCCHSFMEPQPTHWAPMPKRS